MLILLSGCSHRSQDVDTMKADPQYAHLQEELHVYVQYEGDKSHMGSCFSRAVKLIRVVRQIQNVWVEEFRTCEERSGEEECEGRKGNEGVSGY